jgi:glycosyltransferase involved in cell wall biosynthesis
MKILLIGPVGKPLTGQSVANTALVKYLATHHPEISVRVINTNQLVLEGFGKFSGEKILTFMKSYREIGQVFWADCLYVIIGQTFFGVMKYAPFIFLAKLLGKRLVVHIRGGWIHHEYGSLPRWKQRLMKLVMQQFDAGIALSPLLKETLTPFLPPEKIHVIFNFADEIFFENPPPDRPKPTEGSPLRILYMGNLIPEKGIWDVLDAMKMLKQRNVPVKLDIAGGIAADLAARFQGYLEELGQLVTYHGKVEGANKVALYHASEVFVLPTTYMNEGQPNAILEAMVTGNVVLTTYHSGIPDIFQDGVNGWRIESQSADDLAKKIELCYINRPQVLKVGKFNQEIANSKYRLPRFVAELLRVLNGKPS